MEDAVPRAPDPRITFLLNFLTHELPGRPSQWARLREELRRFLYGGEQRVDRGAVVGVLLGRDLADAPEAEIRAFRSDLRKLVARFLDPSAEAVGAALAVSTTVNITLTRAPGTNRMFLTIFGPQLRDVAVTVAAIVLGREPITPIAQCAACPQLFVRSGKKRFHSPRCQARLLMQARRAADRLARASRRRGRPVTSARRATRRQPVTKPPKRRRTRR
jgi:hypothetical protein